MVEPNKLVHQMGTRAHTIPRFYLRGFAAPESDNRSDPFLWVGMIQSGEIMRRSPKNISISRGLYDGPGGFADTSKSIESHLATIESEAAIAIRKLSTDPTDTVIPQEIWRFVAWQAARTPGWMKVEQEWINKRWEGAVVEPPPVGFENMIDRPRSLYVEHPKTGERRDVIDRDEFDRLRENGWKLILRRDDQLELLHMQAWYFQVRHFPRLSWIRLAAPDGTFFITSDRAVAWLVDGYADTPPAALRDPAAQLVAPLTRKVALVGRHGTNPLNVTPREVNRFVAFASAEWIAGPTRELVEEALNDRRDGRH